MLTVRVRLPPWYREETGGGSGAVAGGGVRPAWRVADRARGLPRSRVPRPLGGRAVSVAGDQLARVALTVLVYGRTGSAAWAAATYALTFLPALLGGVLLGGLADRYRAAR